MDFWGDSNAQLGTVKGQFDFGKFCLLFSFPFSSGSRAMKCCWSSILQAFVIRGYLCFTGFSFLPFPVLWSNCTVSPIFPSPSCTYKVASALEDVKINYIYTYLHIPTLQQTTIKGKINMPMLSILSKQKTKDLCNGTMTKMKLLSTHL